GAVPPRRRVAEDGGAELPVDQDAGLLLGYAGGDGAPEAVVDHPLRRRDLRRLLGIQGAFPPEHLGLEGPPVVEGQDVQVLIESDLHGATSRSRRERRMSPFVHESGSRFGAGLPSRSAMRRWASCLLGPTPHPSKE